MTLDTIVADVREGLAARLRVRGKTLAVQMRKAGRRLPRHIRRDLTYLIEAQQLDAHPKRAAQVDMGRATKARRSVLAYLETVDLAAERWTMILGVVASIAFAMLVTGIILLFVLVQRGFV
ncbi:hypothetical protein [Yoonia sp.]|uniref:hypothetical protein n=1 Tax=Yoonia sp. TaxID=2212373 RepID=UPI0023B35F57